MNLKEIRDEAWSMAREVGDADDNRYWTTKDMNRYINRVYRFIARETRCIRDAVTPAVCRIPVVPPVSQAALELAAATNPLYAIDLEEYNDPSSWMYNQLVAPRIFPLSPLILDIDEAKWKSAPWRLTKVSVSKWQNNPYWEKVIGYPTEFCTDYTNGAIALNYRTTQTDTLLMVVRRLPLTDLAKDTDIPELRVNYHDMMLNGILAQMYQKQDIETFNLAKAADYAALYKADIDEIKKQENILDQRLKPTQSLDAFR